MPNIRRITMFKVPNLDDQQELIRIYKAMPTNAIKVLPAHFPAHLYLSLISLIFGR